MLYIVQFAGGNETVLYAVDLGDIYPPSQSQTTIHRYLVQEKEERGPEQARLAGIYNVIIVFTATLTINYVLGQAITNED